MKPVLTLKVYMCIFGNHFPKNRQYLVNGDSDQKNATNKKDAEFNFLYGVRNQNEGIFNEYRLIAVFMISENCISVFTGAPKQKP